MATLAALKKKLAALEAQVEQVTKKEMGTAINKVRKLMSDFGLTIEHLTQEAPVSKPAAKKPGKAAKKSYAVKAVRGSKQPKYRDPSTGVTWAGVGRAPKWIVNAKNRDEFLIDKPAVPGTSAAKSPAGRVASKSAAPVKRAKTTLAAKNAPVKKAVAKKAGSKKVASKKAVGKKTSAKTGASKAGRKAAAKKSGASASSTPATQPGTSGA